MCQTILKHNLNTGEKSIFDHLGEFISEQGSACSWTYATFQCWTTFSHHLKHFNKHVCYEDFNEACINKYVRFLRVDKELEENTVLEAGALAKTRDIFFFCTFTNLRYSDTA